MEAILTALEGSGAAEALRSGRWSYAAVSTAHVFGVALLIGAIIPLNLRLLGLWRTVDRRALARVLVPVAVTGLSLAVAAGVLLFSVRATEYAEMPVLWAKLGFVGVGTASALQLHWRHGLDLASASQRRLAWGAAVSLACWPAALVCGRLIAFF